MFTIKQDIQLAKDTFEVGMKLIKNVSKQFSRLNDKREFMNEDEKAMLSELIRQNNLVNDFISLVKSVGNETTSTNNIHELNKVA